MRKLLTLIIFTVVANYVKAQEVELVSAEETDTLVTSKETLLHKVGDVLTPRTLIWQFAGNIGMHSVGAEWNVLKDQLIVGSAIGYVPDSRSIEPLFIGTLQVKYTSKVKIKVSEAIDIKPLNF